MKIGRERDSLFNLWWCCKRGQVKMKDTGGVVQGWFIHSKTSFAFWCLSLLLYESERGEWKSWLKA